jgi:hypothetical protein
MYEPDKASLVVAGSRVYGAVLVKVKMPLPEEVGEEIGEEVVLNRDRLHPLKKLLEININASDRNNIFFKAGLSFLF